MSARVAVLVFPGTNSEEETARACVAAGLVTDIVRWNAEPRVVRRYAAFVLPGGFAYEDRVRAGAIAAHDNLMSVVREAASERKLVLGICNGAQVLLESGLVPGFAESVRPQAGFAPNAPLGKFRSTHVHIKLSIPPPRCAITAALPEGAVLPAWASHGEGRLSAEPASLARIAQDGHVAFTYCDARGESTEAAVPNGSALRAAGLVNVAGNVLALMPHPERDGWTFQHRYAAREMGRGSARAMLAPSGGSALFESLARALD